MIREKIEIDLKTYEKLIKKQYPFLTDIEAKDLTTELYNFLTDIEAKDLTTELYNFLENWFSLEVENLIN